MEKSVLIHVKGLHAADTGEDGEPVEIFVPGEYYFRNGSHFLRYEEMMEESARPTVNYIRISPGRMEVRKKGLVNTHMVFEQGKDHTALYTTPFGTIRMRIAAIGLTLEESEERIAVKADYALEMNDAHAADCSLSVTVRSCR